LEHLGVSDESRPAAGRGDTTAREPVRGFGPRPTGAARR
jgi:hypothetical protein